VLRIGKDRRREDRKQKEKSHIPEKDVRKGLGRKAQRLKFGGNMEGDEGKTLVRVLWRLPKVGAICARSQEKPVLRRGPFKRKAV